MDKITTEDLVEEKLKLLKVSTFRIIEYIRCSIETIMNLKIEDLEAEFNKRNLFEKDSDLDENASFYKAEPSTIIQKSIKDALKAME